MADAHFVRVLGSPATGPEAHRRMWAAFAETGGCPMLKKVMAAVGLIWLMNKIRGGSNEAAE